MELCLFGPPRLVDGGSQLIVTRRKLIGLLAYLVVTGSAVSRESLAFMFWSEVPDTSARANLRRHLSHLRNLLPPDSLYDTAGRVGIHTSTLSYVDISAFDLGSHGTESPSDLAARRRVLETAISHYRGEFLEGFALHDCPEFSDWQYETAATYRERASGVLVELTDLYEEQGLMDAAVDAARRWVALAPYEERAHRTLMRLLDSVGMRSLALQQYERCRAMLESEYSALPEKSTAALAEAIRENTALRGAAETAEFQISDSRCRVVSILVAGRAAVGRTDDRRAVVDEPVHVLARFLEPILERVECDSFTVFADCVLVTFGSRTSKEDDPDRALGSAISAMASADALPFECSFAIRTGLAYQSGPHLIGSVVSAAMRLQMESEPREVRVDEETRRICRKEYLFERVRAGGYAQFGRKDSLAYAVRERTEPRDAFAGVRYAYPLVNRTRELDALRAGLRSGAPGTDRVTLVHGGAGIGKSRLVFEAVEQFRRNHADGVWLLRAVCNEMDRDRPLWGIAEALRSHFGGIHDPDAVRQAVEELTTNAATVRDSAKRDRERRLPDLACDLVREDLDAMTARDGVPAGDNQGGDAAIRPAEIAARTVAEVLELLQRSRPVIVLVEDLHWADPLTIHAVSVLAADLPVDASLLLTSREDSVAADGVEVIRLEPLSDEDCRRMIAGILGRSESASTLTDEIISGAEGIPLYIEELSEGALIAAPPAVRLGLRLRRNLLARVERLPEQARAVLGAASVVGPVSSRALLSAVMPEVTAIGHQLDELVTAGLIFRETGGAAIDYRFRHVLLQQAVYQGLPGADRSDLHVRVAQAMSRLFGGNLDKHADVISHQYELGGDRASAASFALMAADLARNLFAGDHAVRLYERALSLLDETALPQRAGIYMKLGQMSLRAGHPAEARTWYARGFSALDRSRELQEETPVLQPAPHPFRTYLRLQNTIDRMLVGEHEYPMLLYQLFSGLVGLDQRQSCTAEGALRWDISDDGTVYIFDLNPAAHWSDGTPVTAGDYVRGIKEVIRTGSEAARAYLRSIAGADEYAATGDDAELDRSLRAVSERRLSVRLTHADPVFLYSLSMPCGFPVPSHLVERYGRVWTDPAHIVTNGPFEILEWDPDSRIVLRRNCSYCGSFPGNLREIRFLKETDPAEGFVLYSRDEIELYWPHLKTWREVWRRYSSDLRMFDSYGADIILFNPNRWPFSNESFRRALCMCYDGVEHTRQLTEQWAESGISQMIFPEATGGVISREHPAHNPGINPPYDPAKARSLLAASGVEVQGTEPQFTLTLPSFPLGPYLDVQPERWREVLDINVRIRRLGWDDLMRSLNDFDYDAIAYRFDYFAGDLRGWLPPGAFAWRDPHFRELLDRFARSADAREMIKLAKEMDRMIVEHAIAFPCRYLLAAPLLKPWVKLPPVWRAGFTHFKHAVILPH